MFIKLSMGLRHKSRALDDATENEKCMIQGEEIVE
jgi:hypothetical protein